MSKRKVSFICLCYEDNIQIKFLYCNAVDDQSYDGIEGVSEEREKSFFSNTVRVLMKTKEITL